MRHAALPGPLDRPEMLPKSKRHNRRHRRHTRLPTHDAEYSVYVMNGGRDYALLAAALVDLVQARILDTASLAAEVRTMRMERPTGAAPDPRPMARNQAPPADIIQTVHHRGLLKRLRSSSPN